MTDSRESEHAPGETERGSDLPSADLPSADLPSADSLSEQHASILQFESRAWGHAGVKDEAIRVELGLTSARYYQLLNAAIESPAAVKHDPMLVRRLRRIRDGRARGISAGAEPEDL
ncbi:DUF3263 domain-containing protein [Homoserinimonas hongtaonis]|uniref:DUF3263 domain-containing protein n=1 Tax=Homoserinimonas hongtaonis TaxID=2079791 RepID=A0A2U1T467_9MICO|nr:DUF3263 domain-containing protein [Salinibacterium hongtaonis]PWB98563.1 DUF3263 domain-containing protein [Salinibacterium hongtaonis]